MRYRPRLLHALILLGVVVAGGWMLLVNLDPQTLKAAAIGRVKAATSRTLTIEGDLQIDYWPKLAVRMEQLTLGNAPGFDERPMLVVRSLEVAVALFPLLSGELELDTLRLDGLIVNLERKADGSNNWDDLGAQRKQPDETPDLGKLAALALGGVDITGTEVHWIDGAASREIHLTNAGLQSAPLAFGEPVEFSVRGDLAATQPALSGPVKLSGTALYDPAKLRYTVDPLSFQAELKGQRLPGGRARIKGNSRVKLDPRKQRLQIEALSLEGLGHNLSGDLTLEQSSGNWPATEGTLALRGQDFASLLRALELPIAERVASLGNRGISLDTDFKLDLTGGTLAVPTLKGQALGVQISAQGEAEEIQGDAARFEGAVDLRGNDLPGLVLVLNQALNPDTPARGALVKAMGKVGDRRFGLKTRFKGDRGEQKFQLDEGTLEAFGTTSHLSLTEDPKARGSTTPLRGTLTSAGRDLAPLVLTGASLQGLDEAALASLSALMEGRKAKSYEMAAAVNLDVGNERLELRSLKGSLLGNPLEGTLVLDAAAGPSGTVSLQGPDLPALLGLAGALSASPVMVETGRRLAMAKDQSFSAEVGLMRDPAARSMVLSPLNASAFGVSLSARLAMADLAADGAGKVEAILALRGQDLQPLFSALEYPALAQQVDTFVLEAAMDGSTRAISLQPSALQVRLRPARKSAPTELSLSAQKGSANLEAGTFTLDNIALTGPGLAGTGSFRSFMRVEGGLGYEANLEIPPFDLRRLFTMLGQPAPDTRDVRALTKVGLQLRAQGDASKHALNEVTLNLDETRMNADFLFETGEVPALSFTLAIDQLDADRYLGNTTNDKAEAITPEVIALGAMRLPKARLRALRIDGQAACKTLRYAGAKLSNLDLALKAEAGKFALAPVKARLYGGRYRGEFLLDVNGEGPTLDSSTTLAKINLAPLLADTAARDDLAGVLNFEARLSMRGKTSAQQLASLGGQASFAITEGEIKGLDLPAVLRAAEITLERKRPEIPPTGGSTRFRSVTGSLNVERGVVQNRNLLMEGEGFQITGEGALADLPRKRMDFAARLRVPPGTTEAQGHRYNLGDYEIPIRCRGPLAVKSCRPDLAGLVDRETRKALQKSAEKLIEEKAGGAGKAIKKLLEF